MIAVESDDGVAVRLPDDDPHLSSAVPYSLTKTQVRVCHVTGVASVVEQVGVKFYRCLHFFARGAMGGVVNGNEVVELDAVAGRRIVPWCRGHWVAPLVKIFTESPTDQVTPNR